MMGTETVPETSVIFNQQTQLTAWEDFITWKVGLSSLISDI
jgi:hypothetical protein